MNLNKMKGNDHPWKSRSGVRLLLSVLVIMAVVFSSTACSITVAGIGLEITSIDRNGNVIATVTLSNINRTNFLKDTDNELKKISIYYAFTEAKAAALAGYAGIDPTKYQTIIVPQTAYDGFSSVDISTDENNAFKTDPTEPTSFSKQLSFQLPAEAKEKNIAFLVVLDGTDDGLYQNSYWSWDGSGSSVIFNYTWEDSGFTVTYVANGGSGSMRPWSGAAGTKIRIDACGFLPPAGMTFVNWYCPERDTSYNPMQEITVDKNLTLVAVWGSRGGGSGSGLADVVFNIPGVDNSWEYIGGVPQRAYRLSFAPMQGGSAYFLLNSGETGETINVYPQSTVRVVPTPAPGYRLASIVWSMIDGSASYDITETQTFVVPAMDAVVYVTFQPVA